MEETTMKDVTDGGGKSTDTLTQEYTHTKKNEERKTNNLKMSKCNRHVSVQCWKKVKKRKKNNNFTFLGLIFCYGSHHYFFYFTEQEQKPVMLSCSFVCVCVV